MTDIDFGGEALAVHRFSTTHLPPAERYHAWLARDWPRPQSIFRTEPIEPFDTKWESAQLGPIMFVYTEVAESGLRPSITVRQGEANKVIREVIADNPDIAALVLASAASGAPGPLIGHFVGSDAAALSVPLMIVPGSLDNAAIDRLS